jgi:large subunit ribosomal protein L22
MSLLVDEIRGKGINEALTYLKFSPRKRTAGVLAKLLKSAVANAAQKNSSLDVDSLFVKSLLVGQGTTMKRFRPRAKGSAFRISKKTSNVTVVVAERSKR